MPVKKKAIARSAKISDLIPDHDNANLGTERGHYLLNQSVEQGGIGRGIVVDRNLRIIGGNKTHEVAGGLGLDDVILVPTDGTKLVVTVREDLDLAAEPGSEQYIKARTLALSDNRAGQENLLFSPQAIANYAAGGVELDDWFRPVELDSVFTPVQQTDGGHENGQATAEEGGQDSEKNKAPTGTLIPLAVSLSSADNKRWKAFKEKVGIKKDSGAFLKLLELAEAD